MGSRSNNIGFLRLAFASLVIVGHAPEMIDGDRGREPLTRLLGGLSLGELSVDAFFLLSGFLIAKSMTTSPSLGDFILRRTARIFPAFAIAYLLSVYLLGPAVGAHPLHYGLMPVVPMLLLQHPPVFPGQLTGLPYPGLNEAMWTIAYEFRCYLLVASLGVAGLLARRRAVLLLTAAALVSYALIGPAPAGQAGLESGPAGGFLVGEPMKMLRFLAAFLVGTCWFLYREEALARLNAWRALLCALLAAAALRFGGASAEPAVVLLGGAALFWLAFEAPLGRLQRVNDRYDISYGTYLYGWPVATAWLWFNRDIGPAGLTMLTLPAALALGTASWWIVERPALAWVRSRPAGATRRAPPPDRPRSASLPAG
ncbi:MAG TPA: acyltransferase [Allosphingosinicella sp.]